jgi:uncharacterized membrane-anchored protein
VAGTGTRAGRALTVTRVPDYRPAAPAPDARALSKVPQVTLLFWLAFVLTRPLGAVVGDFLDKPLADGGLALDRFAASGVLLGFIVLSLVLVRSRPAPAPH